ncbi:P63C domain-containing protein [Falsiroseomonas sp.]|uniref:P63C domain-containing protein n=1 Tax=Falsiroseomonas sp. TaxID=2870721 RepID=UPI003568BA1A
MREAISREGVLRIADQELQCYVLEDETRVLARAGFVRAIGRTGKVKGGRRFDDEFQTPVFLTAENLRPFWPDGLTENSAPIPFSYGGQEMIGYRAELLPDVCDVFADAERAGVLRRNQEHIAAACRLLARGLTRVGIIGLVDEATGFQRERAANALAEILEAFIAKEIRPWVRTFPDEFYGHLFRLRGLEFPRDTVKRPQYFGHLTNDIIYRRLAPRVLEELQAAVPKTPSGRRRHALFQRLTDDVGHPRLREHLSAVITVMKLSGDYNDFIKKLDLTHPRFGDNYELPFDENRPGL